MQAGSLNEIILVEEQSFEKNPNYGDQKTERWRKKFKTRAKVSYEHGERTNDNNELFFAATVKFHVRSYCDIKNLDRIVWLDNKYRILNIEYQRKLMMKVITTELINE